LPVFTCQARVITVDDDGPADFNNIQAAINDSNDGDIIEVKPGIYTGEGNRDIEFGGRAITVRSENGPEDCIINIGASGIDWHTGFYVHEGPIEESIIEGFTIKGGYVYEGGAIYCWQASLTVKNCIITENTAGFGGGIYCRNSNANIYNCLIAGNKGWDAAGGIYIPNSTTTVTNCTIVDNRSPYGGGGILWDSSSGDIVNCIIWGNSDEQIVVIESGPDSITYNDVQGGWEEQGNIEADPCFVSPGYWDANGTPGYEEDDFWVGGDYHLLGDSACIDAGTDAGVYTDIESKARPLDIYGIDNNGELPEFDIGAYEYYPEVPYIGLSKGRFIFVTFEIDLDLPDQNLQISNLGKDSFVWEISEDCSWLEVFPTTGEVNGTEVNDVALQIDANGVEPGKYTCQLTVSSEQAMNNPQTVEVIFYVYIDDDALIVPTEYALIQDAIDAAVDSNTVIVTPKTYNENIDFKGKSIILRSIEPNNWLIVEETVIQGNGTGSVVTFSGNEDANCKIAGFTVTGGDNTELGGGICGNGCLAAIENCMITGNSTDMDRYGHGGGLEGCDGSIINCIISDNSAGYGGGGLSNCHGSITNCTITDNSTIGGGGGLERCNGSITNCTITGNSAVGGGGGLMACGGSIANCIISDNSANGYIHSHGGGLHICDGPITNCIITGNSADEYGGGLEGCDGPITNCIISNNSAGDSGGGLGWCHGSIKNSTITGNTAADKGGGLYRFNSDISNCIIWGNSPDSLYNCSEPSYSCFPEAASGLGNINTDPCFADPNGDYHLRSEAGRWDPNLYRSSDFTQDGIVNFKDFANLANFWHFEAPNLPVDLNRDGAVNLEDLSILSRKFLTSGSTGGWTVDFVTSRCVDAGNPGSALDAELNGPNNIRINMGVYGGTAEASKTPINWSLLADLTNDGTVDFVDLEEWVKNWLSSGNEWPSDLDRNGIVDMFDFSLITQDWLLETSWYEP